MKKKDTKKRAQKSKSARAGKKSGKHKKSNRKIALNIWAIAFFIMILIILVSIPHIKDISSSEKGDRIPVGGYAYGIDISHYQTDIVWDSLMVLTDGHDRTIRSTTAAKEIKPVSFVFIKATEGISLKDRHFTKNWKNADETGIRKGAYHFFRSSKDPSGQADNFIKTVGDISSDDLPPVLDIETIHKGCSKEELNRRALIWMKKIEQHYGRKPIVYSPASFINDILSEEIKENYPIWVAHYRSDRPDAEKWDLWQCTDKGVIYGIKGMTDISVCTTDALRAL